MATTFDPAKLSEALSRYSYESKETLKNLEDMKDAEKELVDLAKQLGQVYKTNNDKFKESLKGKTLEENITSRLERSTEELGKLESARLMSLSSIKNNESLISQLNAQILAHSAGSLALTNDELNKLHEQVVEKQREVNLEEDLLKKSQLQLDVLRQQTEELKSQKNIYEQFKKLINFIKNDLKIEVPTSFGELIKQTYERFRDIDKAATSVRQKFGLLRSEGGLFEKNIREVTTELAEFGVNADVAGTVIKDIGSTFTSLQAAEKDLVKDISLMNAQFGIASGTSAKFLKTMGGISGTSATASKNMLGFAKMASTAYGVGLDDVMNDIADASEEARMFAGKNADEMVRAAAQARQMGTTLNNMASTAKGMLNFETSIQAELKASALIGKNINFNEARRLFMQGKTVEANKVILEQAKKIKFNQLNPIAQEAFAAAANKSVKELQDMYNAEQNLNAALKSQDPQVRELAEKRKKMAEIVEKGSAAEKASQQKAYEEGMKREHNQERIVILQNRLNAALQKLMLPTLEAITKAADLLIYIFDKFKPEELIGPLIKVKLMFGSVGTALRETLLFPLRVAGGYLSKLGEVGWIKSMLSPITTLVDKVKLFIDRFKYARSFGASFAQSFTSAGNAVGGIFTKIGNLLTKVSKPVDFVIDKFKMLKTFLSSIFSPVINAIKPIFGAFKSVGEGSKFLKPILGFLKIGKVGLKAVPVLGEIIMAIEFITNVWKRISVIFKDPNLNIGQKIFASVVGLYGAIYDTLIQPFIDIGEWIIKAVWGEKILDGIKSVVGNLFQTLKQPFAKAYDWIMDKLGGKSPSEIGLSIVKGIESVVDMLFDSLIYPFKKAQLILPEIIHVIKTMFVEAFKSTVDVIFELILYPFKKAKKILPETINFIKITLIDVFNSMSDALFDLITNPFKKGFELIKSAVSEVGLFFKTTFESTFSFVTLALEKVWEKIKGIGGFISNLLEKGFSFVGKIVGGVGQSNEEKSKTETSVSDNDSLISTMKINNDLLIKTITSTNGIVAEKLDKLAQLMTSGQIAVYIDGQKANQILATSANKFGSFGQATTT